MNNFALLISFVVFLFSGCQNDQDPIVVKEEFSLKSLELIEKTDEFNWKLFQTMNNLEDAGKNLVVSPLSISQAFGMVINGATGSNLEEMLEVFGYENSDGMNTAYKNIRGALSTTDPKVTIGIANSAWYNNQFVMKQGYVQNLRDYYDAEITALDFGQEEYALKTINGWVNNKTNGKIPSIIDNISNSHVLFLINAVYFYGTWANKFDKANTADAPFYLTNGSNIQVKMMHQETSLELIDGEIYTALRVPYANGSFAMTILLPDEGIAVDDVIGELNSNEWSKIRTEQPKQNMKLVLPRFKTECSYDLIPALKELGMNEAFYSSQGFGNITDQGISLSDVKHKTFIEVDEKGTEAAAVTSGTFVTSMPPQPPIFRVDRPFVFIISEKTSGAVTFIGKIENPLLVK